MPRSEAEARTVIEETFPNLRGQQWAVASCYQPRYNCVAWACHDDADRWEPILAFWPADVAPNMRPSTVVQLFELLGYEVCPTDELEPGFEKVAIYLDDQRFNFGHVARQLESGRWISKLGSWEDIEHPDLAGLQGNRYGTARIFLRRPRGR